MASPRNHQHHNVNRKHKQHQPQHSQKRGRSQGSTSSNDTPHKRVKDSNIERSPTVFEILDSFPDTHDITAIVKNRIMADNVINECDSNILLHRVLNTLDKLTLKVDNYHEKMEGLNQRITTLENCYSSVDVKLDINNNLINKVCDSMDYPPERCIIASNIPFADDENITNISYTIIQRGLNLENNVSIIRAKRLVGSSGQETGAIMIEFRSVGERIQVMRSKYRLRYSDMTPLRQVYIRPVESRLEVQFRQGMMHAAQQAPMRNPHTQMRQMEHKDQQQTYNPHFRHVNNYQYQRPPPNFNATYRQPNDHRQHRQPPLLNNPNTTHRSTYHQSRQPNSEMFPPSAKQSGVGSASQHISTRQTTTAQVELMETSTPVGDEHRAKINTTPLTNNQRSQPPPHVPHHMPPHVPSHGENMANQTTIEPATAPQMQPFVAPSPTNPPVQQTVAHPGVPFYPATHTVNNDNPVHPKAGGPNTMNTDIVQHQPFGHQGSVVPQTLMHHTPPNMQYMNIQTHKMQPNMNTQQHMPNDAYTYIDNYRHMPHMNQQTVNNNMPPVMVPPPQDMTPHATVPVTSQSLSQTGQLVNETHNILMDNTCKQQYDSNFPRLPQRP